MMKTTDSEALPDPSSLEADERGSAAAGDVSQDLLNSIPAVIFRCALDDGRLLSLNAAWLRLLGYDPQICLGQPLGSFVVGSQQGRLRQALDRLRTGLEPSISEELRFFHASGEEITAELKLASRHGRAEAIGVLHDLTVHHQTYLRQKIEDEKKQQAERLESLGKLAGGIAHDFNNLLMGMLGNADLALAKLSPFSPGCEHIRGIVTHARRAADLCRQMLAYSGKGKFKIEAVELTTLIDEMKHLIATSVPDGVALEYELAIGLPSIEADPPQIQQMIIHLVQNAGEAIGEGSGTITITSGVQYCDRADLHRTLPGDDLPEGNYTYLEVSDTGCGLDEESRARIFEPFFSTKKMAGRGLGLAAVLGIVRGHNGTIQVQSELGRGTAIKVLFPSSEQPAAEAPQISLHDEADASAGTILVVDDEEIVRSVARGMLELLGYHVLTAGDGYEAIKIFRERGNEIVLVVLDLAMPHLSGEETFEGLRAIQPDVRVVLSSGYDEQEATLHFAGKGLAGFIQKPYEVAAFSRVIHDALEGTGVL